MKKILTVITISFCSFFVTAQDIKHSITKGEILRDDYKYSKVIFVEDDGFGGVIVLKSCSGGSFSRGLGYNFEHYDSNLKLTKEYEYKLEESKTIKQNKVLGVFKSGTNVYLINFAYDTSQNAYVCNALTSTIDNFNFKSQELFKIETEMIEEFNYFTNPRLDYDSGASMFVNDDNTAFAVNVALKDKNTETHKIYVFDTKFTVNIEHLFKRTIEDRRFKFENIDVSLDGKTLYLLGKVYTKEKKNSRDGANYQFELTRITKDSEKTQIFDTNEHFTNTLNTIIFQDKLTCLGFYSDQSDLKYKGVCYLEFDPVTLAVKKTKFNPFTEQFLIDKYGEEKNEELKDISLKKITITPNGIFFNAEEQYRTTSASSQFNSYRDNYDDIICAKIDSSGDLVWARNINKRQYSTGTSSDSKAYLSYTSTIKNGDTYFFINADDKVKKIKNDRIRFGQNSAKNSNLYVIKVSANGDFDYQEILNAKDNKVPFRVVDGTIIKDSVIFIGQDEDIRQLLKVTLN